MALLSEKGDALVEFIKHADCRDAGQDAALNSLAVDLGDLVGGFLGPGAWRPQRKAIAEIWRAQKAETGSSSLSQIALHHGASDTGNWNDATTGSDCLPFAAKP